VTEPQEQPGGSFNLADADLRTAQDEFDRAAYAVQQEFAALVARVSENPSEGDTFLEAKKVAAALEAEGLKFRDLTRRLAQEIGESAQSYQALNAAGADKIAQIGRSLPDGGGATFSRLVPGGPQ